MHNGKWEKRRCRYYSADTGHTGCIADGNIYKMQQSIASLPSSSSKQSNNKTNKKTTYSPALSLEFPNFVFYKIHLMVSSPSKFSFSPYLHHLPSNPHHQKIIISYQCYHHQHSFFFSPVVSFMMIIISFFTRSSCSFPSPKKSSSRPTTRPTGVLFPSCYSGGPRIYSDHSGGGHLHDDILEYPIPPIIHTHFNGMISSSTPSKATV